MWLYVWIEITIGNRVRLSRETSGGLKQGWGSGIERWGWGLGGEYMYFNIDLDFDTFPECP